MQYSHSKKYITEAKRRGLTCGIKGQPIVKKKTCYQDTLNCTNAQLCTLATTGQGNSKSWEQSSYSKKYLTEAKRRGLSCGAKVKPTVKKKACYEDTKACTVARLCGFATVGSGNSKRWRSNPYNKKYVSEAKRRGLSCGVKVQPIVKKKTCYQDTLNCTNAQLCTLATTGQGNSKSWEQSSYSKKYLTEAKRRGLSCGVKWPIVKPTVKKKTCSQNLKFCSEKNLCEINAKHGAGLTLAQFKNYQVEIKKRGLSCGLTVKNNGFGLSNIYNFNRDDFSKLSKLRQKQLQYGLKKLGYYRSSIDGIYGSGTENAVRKYAKLKRIRDGYPASIYNRLISEVPVPTSFTVTKPTKHKATEPSKKSPDLGLKLLFGIGAAILCKNNLETCGGIADGINGNTRDSNISSSSTRSNSNSSFRSNKKQCNYDSQCGFREKCIKRLGKSICVKLVDKDERKIRGSVRGIDENECRRDNDCPRKFKCNRQFRICVKK